MLFKTNYRQDPRIGFEMKKKEKYKRAKRFVIKIRKIQEKANKEIYRPLQSKESYIIKYS